MMTEYRVELLESLGRQLQLHELRARGGGKACTAGPGAAPTTTGRRVGAGLLAALEVRIGLEFASTMAESHRIMEAEEDVTGPRASAPSSGGSARV